jgi:large subunit ribosomal protein L22
MKPIADLIRSKKVTVAERLLAVSPRRTARIMLKLLRSAVANAENNPDMGDVDSLYVSRVDVGPGPMMKRAQFKARGRVMLIRHRTSHVRIVLQETEELGMEARDSGLSAGTKVQD